MNDILNNLGIWKLYHLLQLISDIHAHLSTMMDIFLQSLTSGIPQNPASMPTAQQMVALRRLDWFAPLIREHLKELADHLQIRRPDHYINRILVDQCSAWINTVEWKSWGALFEALGGDPTLADSKGVSFMKSISDEAIEEVCYALRLKLVHPMDESTYCGVARSLICRLCQATARHTSAWVGSDADHTALYKIFVVEANRAAESILKENKLDDLAIESKDILKRYVLEDSNLIKKLNKKRKGAKVLMVSKGKDYIRPAALPINRASGGFTLHTQWYLCRQVIFIVNIFAAEFLGEEASLRLNDQLCCDFKIEDEARNYLLDHPIKTDDKDDFVFLSSARTEKDLKGNQLKWDEEIYHDLEAANARALYEAGVRVTTKMQKSKQQRRRLHAATGTGCHRGSSLVFWGLLWPSLERMGWFIQNGNRPNDFYFFPAGVTRQNGRNRFDFFDSAALVLHAIQNDPRWKHQDGIKSALQTYNEMMKNFYSIKDSSYPKGGTKEEKFAWIQERAKAMTDGASISDDVAATDRNKDNIASSSDTSLTEAGTMTEQFEADGSVDNSSTTGISNSNIGSEKPILQVIVPKK